MASTPTIAQLIDDLRSGTVEDRLVAIHALRDRLWQHPGAQMQLVRQHPSFFRRLRDRLGRRSSFFKEVMSEDQRAIHTFIELLPDESSVTDEDGKTTTISSEVAITLARIGEPAIERLIAALQDPGLQWEAMYTLWQMEELHAGPAVARLLNAVAQPSTRDAALAALLCFVNIEGNPILHRNVGRAWLLERILADRDAGEVVARELPRFKEFRSRLTSWRRPPDDFHEEEQRLIHALIEALPFQDSEVDRQKWVIERAILALSLMGQAAVPPLIALLGENWRVDSPQWFFAGRALQVIGAPAVEPLKKLLEEYLEKLAGDRMPIGRPEWKAFREVTDILVEIGDQRATPVLLKALSNDSLVRIALEALGKIGDETALFPLLDLAEVDYNLKRADVAMTVRQNPRLLRRLEAIGANAHRLLCSQCLARFEQHSEEGVTYWVCRLCHRASTALEDIAKVIVVIRPEATAVANARFDSRGVQVHQEDGTIRMNWPQARELWDFDEVWVGSATDADVEEFVMQVRNDTDLWRRNRYKSLPIVLQSSQKLSQNNMSLLADTFGTVNRAQVTLPTARGKADG